MKILAVEDDVIARTLLAAALKALGHDVTEASDGERAWEALMDRGIRVVVCDWRLPGLDGLALCRKIRDERPDYVCFTRLAQLPATNENVEAAFAAGVDEFLTKPMNPLELRLRLHV